MPRFYHGTPGVDHYFPALFFQARPPSSVKTKKLYSVLAAALVAILWRGVSLPALPSCAVRRGAPKSSNGTNAALVEHTQTQTRVRIFWWAARGTMISAALRGKKALPGE